MTKTAIITGVSEGLGYQLATQLLAKGWHVVGISRRKPGLGISHISADLTSETDLNAVVAKIEQEFSSFQLLVNCAAELNIKPLAELDYTETEHLFRLNVVAPIYLCAKLIELIKQNEADIVNIGSTIGAKAYEEQLAYGASKWAIRGINANLQQELKKTKCRVIGFNPGGFRSKIFEKATGVEITEWDNYMKPEELASLIISLVELPKNMEVSEIWVNRK